MSLIDLITELADTCFKEGVYWDQKKFDLVEKYAIKRGDLLVKIQKIVQSLEASDG